MSIAFLAAATLAVPLIVALSGRTYAGEDLPTSYYPHVEVLRRGLAESGGLPLWNFHEFGGTPFLGNLVDGVFYPPNSLFFLIPTVRALEILVVLHLALAAFGLYRLTRSYRLPRGACTLAACAYVLSLTLVARLAAGHYGTFLTLTQAPLLLFLIRTVVQKVSLRYALRLALYAALIPLAGHAPFVYQLALVAAAFAVAELVAVRRERRQLIRSSRLLVAAGVLAVLLDAILLLPALEVRSHATRAGMVASQVASERNPDRSFLPRDAGSFAVPFYPRERFLNNRNWLLYFLHEKAVYVGLLPLLGAAAAMFSTRHRRPAIFFAALGALSIVEAMAWHLPVHRIATAILPGYGAFRVPARGVWIAALAVCILAAFGLARWPDVPRPIRLRFLIGVAAAAVLFSIALAATSGLRTELAVFVLVLSTGGVILWVADARPAALLAATALTIVELGGQGAAFVPTAPVEAMSPKPWYLSSLGTDPAEHRVLDAGAEWSGSAPAASGVRLMNGGGYPLLERTRHYYSEAWDPPPAAGFDDLGVGKRVINAERLDAFNVGWIVWTGPAPEEGLIEVARRGETVLYRRPTVHPYARIGTTPVAASRLGSEVRAAVDAAGTLVVSEAWMPGWKAQVDGRPVEIVPARGVFLSVAVPEGAHEVRFTYSPAGYWWGRLTTLTTLVAILSVLAVVSLAARKF